MSVFKRSFFFSAIFFTFFISSCNTKETDTSFTITDTPLPPLKNNSIQVPGDTTIEVTALQLSSDYIANEVRADKLYKNRSLIIKGSIQQITKGVAGDIYVVLAGANRQRTILCEFNNEEQAALLQKRQTVSLKGVCDGLMGSIVMNNCILAE